MKKLKYTMTCEAYYNSSIALPRDDMTEEEAIAYAKGRMEELCKPGELEWRRDIKLDEDSFYIVADEEDDEDELLWQNTP